MATKSLLAKKTVCQGRTREDCHLCHKMQKPRLLIICIYWLSTRLDIQTVNLATASLPTHTCFTILLFDCKIFSVISGGFVQVRCIASPHTFRTALLFTDTARIPCDRQPTMSLWELTLLITAFIAVWLSHYRASAMSV